MPADYAADTSTDDIALARRRGRSRAELGIRTARCASTWLGSQPLGSMLPAELTDRELEQRLPVSAGRSTPSRGADWAALVAWS